TAVLAFEYDASGARTNFSNELPEFVIYAIDDNSGTADGTGVVLSDSPGEGDFDSTDGDDTGGPSATITGARFTYRLVFTDEIVPGTDAEIARLLRTELAEKGIAFHCGARVEAIESDAVRFTDAQGQGQSCPADSVLMATGRRPNVEDLGLEDVGVAVDGGRIAIDAACRTNVPGIWAAGDCTGKILLAHLASRQAECVVNNICGRADRMRYHAVPGVIYTRPSCR
ncbi:MAG: FAD-dependent oxidoreductase, partial [Planctomycetota bacterium]